MKGILTIISSVLAIVIGLWKHYGGKRRAKAKAKKEAYDEYREGVKHKDTSRITASLNKLNRLQR